MKSIWEIKRKLILFETCRVHGQMRTSTYPCMFVEPCQIKGHASSYAKRNRKSPSTSQLDCTPTLTLTTRHLQEPNLFSAPSAAPYFTASTVNFVPPQSPPQNDSRTQYGPSARVVPQNIKTKNKSRGGNSDYKEE